MTVSAPFSRARLSAGNRGVDEAEPAPPRLGVKLARDVGRGGRVVDEDRRRASCRRRRRRGPEPPSAGRRRCRRRRIRNRARPPPRAASGRCAPPYWPTQASRLRGGSVVDRNRMAAARWQVSRHRIAHDAQGPGNATSLNVRLRGDCAAGRAGLGSIASSHDFRVLAPMGEIARFRADPRRRHARLRAVDVSLRRSMYLA